MDQINYQIINQDCIDYMNSQPEGSIECIITSPPYNLDINYGKYQDDLPRESYLKWLHDVAVAMKRVLTDDGQLFLNVGYSNNDPWVAMDVAQAFRDVFVLQNNFTWIKHIKLGDQSHGLYKPITSDRYVSPTTESIFHFTKTGNVKIDRLAIGHRNTTHEKYPELYSESRHIAEQRRKVVKKMGYTTWVEFQKQNPDTKSAEWEQFGELMTEQEKKKPWDPDKKKCIGNAWYVPYTPVSKLAKDAGSNELGTRDSGRGGHPATFPEALPEMCVKLSGIAEGSTVYDPFNGTGTTLVAALKLGMRAVGTDIDTDYIEFAETRIDNLLSEPEEFQITLDPVLFEIEER